MHPRAEAFEVNKAKAICAEKGHVPQWRDWYDRRSYVDRLEPCRRCGEPVPTQTDWSGHP